MLQTSGLQEDTRFSRPKANLSYTFFGPRQRGRKALLTLGVYAEQEKNARRTIAADTLHAASFQYDLVRAYLQTPEKAETWQFGASVSRRHDYAPRPSDFSLATVADEMSVNGQWNNQGSSAPTRHQLSWNMTLRKLAVEAPELTKAEPQNSYLGRVDYNINALKNALNLSTGYEIGSGQSPKLEFNYLHVNPGEGQFTWIDRNRDSILQIDEMELAVFLDQADYVRVAVSTPDYVRTNNVLLSQNLRLEPRLLWAASRRGWRHYMSRLATQHTLQINRRTFADAQGISPWNPFQFSIADTALANLSASLRNILFVNRANPQWDASLAQSDNQNQVVLTTGFEKRRNADWTLHGRLNLGTRWSADADLVRAQKTSSNESFSTRDFAIQSWQASPGLNWLPNRNFRLAGRMKWQDSKNILGGQENAKRLEWNLEMTWNPAMQQKQGFRAASSLRAKTTFADIKYNGTANSSVAFVMLEGLQDGRNFLWSLTLDHQLSKNLQLNISYEGRKTGENRVVHVGRAQIRAVL